MDVGQSPCSLANILLSVLLATQAVPPIHPTSGCLQWWSWQVLVSILHMPPSTSCGPNEPSHPILGGGVIQVVHWSS
ncbi:hypothetical protein L208DRAFT_1417953 [Tricholoma matsutake]|nr:hypothetical protein L208DRAFT_1417953 [Tricholoma matsutake 945]